MNNQLRKVIKVTEKQEDARAKQLKMLITQKERAVLARVDEIHKLGTLPPSLGLLQSELSDARQELKKLQGK